MAGTPRTGAQAQQGRVVGASVATANTLHLWLMTFKRFRSQVGRILPDCPGGGWRGLQAPVLLAFCRGDLDPQEVCRSSSGCRGVTVRSGTGGRFLQLPCRNQGAPARTSPGQRPAAMAFSEPHPGGSCPCCSQQELCLGAAAQGFGVECAVPAAHTASVLPHRHQHSGEWGPAPAWACSLRGLCSLLSSQGSGHTSGLRCDAVTAVPSAGVPETSRESRRTGCETRAY